MTRSVRRIVGTRPLTRAAVIPRDAADKILEKAVKVKCAFCDGTGKDPFGCMSHLSNCQVCKGKGTVWMFEPYKECAFCEGTGIQPHSPHRIHCGACGGKGAVEVIEPSIACPTCGGSGIIMAPLPQYCLTCKGQGVIRRRD